MNAVTRGIRNAFRNLIRTIGIVVIVGLVIGLSLAMLVANQAVTKKIASVKASVGNTIAISPAGARDFEGGGTALTATETAKVAALPHVTNVVQSLSDRLTTDTSNLQSAVDAGSLGRRNAETNGTSSNDVQQPTAPPNGMGGASGATGTTGGQTTTRSFTPPVTVNGTTDPTKLSIGGGSFTLKDGAVFDKASTENVAIVGTTLATKNNLKVGSTFTAYKTSVKVVGLFDSGNTFGNNQVIMPLSTLQKLSAQPGAITSATATVDSIENVATVTAAVKTALGSSADVTNDVTRADEVVTPLQNIQKISLYSLIGAVIAGAVIILLSMIMIVRERRREIGVIKAIGASNLRVIVQFMSEAVTLTVLGAVVGIVIGVAAASPLTKVLVSNSATTTTTDTRPVGRPGGFGRAARGIGSNVTNVKANVSLSIVGYGLGAAVIIALVGSAAASLIIAKVRPAEVMRAE